MSDKASDTISRVLDICKVDPVFGCDENFVIQLGELTVLAPQLAKALKIALDALKHIGSMSDVDREMFCDDNVEMVLSDIEKIFTESRA